MKELPQRFSAELLLSALPVGTGFTQDGHTQPRWGEFGAGRRGPVVGLQNCEQTGWTNVAVLGFAAAA